MNSLLLDRSTWDLCKDANGNIAVAAAPYALAQDAASYAKTFKGECWYDTTLGIPYFTQIFSRFPPIQLMKAEYVKAALAVPGVVGAVCYLSSVVGRQVSGQLLLTDRAGAKLNVGF